MMHKELERIFYIANRVLITIIIILFVIDLVFGAHWTVLVAMGIAVIYFFIAIALIEKSKD